MLDSQSFVIGFAVGFIFTLFLGNFAGRIRKNRAASSKSGKKVSVAVSGSDSPREIVGKAAGAGARMTIWFLVVVALAVVTLYGLYRLWSLSPSLPYDETLYRGMTAAQSVLSRGSGS
jgi:hypothetical protein